MSYLGRSRTHSHTHALNCSFFFLLSLFLSFCRLCAHTHTHAIIYADRYARICLCVAKILFWSIFQRKKTHTHTRWKLLWVVGTKLEIRSGTNSVQLIGLWHDFFSSLIVCVWAMYGLLACVCARPSIRMNLCVWLSGALALSLCVIWDFSSSFVFYLFCNVEFA